MFSPRSLLGLLLEHLLDDLLLLDEEGPDDAVADALVAAGSAVGAADLPLPLLEVLEVGGLVVLDAGEGGVAVSAVGALVLLGDDVGGVAASGGLHLCYEVRPGGVRVTRALLDSAVRHFVLLFIWGGGRGKCCDLWDKTIEK